MGNKKKEGRLDYFKFLQENLNNKKMNQFVFIELRQLYKKNDSLFDLSMATFAAFCVVWFGMYIIKITNQTASMDMLFWASYVVTWFIFGVYFIVTFVQIISRALWKWLIKSFIKLKKEKFSIKKLKLWKRKY